MTPRPTTLTALLRVIRELWTPEFDKRFPDEAEEAELAFVRALLGKPLPEDARDLALYEQHRSSLPRVWASLWRPMKDGRSGVEAARRAPKLRAPVLQAALDRLAAARGVYAEIVGIERARGLLLARDLFDEARYAILDPGGAADRVALGARFFGFLVDLGDGTWMFPSVFGAHPHFNRLSPADLIAIAREAIAAEGLDPDEIDPAAPHAGLARRAGLVYGAVMRAGEALPPD